MLTTGVVALMSLLVGTFSISVSDALRALAGQGDPSSILVIQGLRLPRIADAVLVGLALGVSGAIFQELMHNPLASPDILGVESGAAMGAVIAIVASGGQTLAVAGGAVIGGLTATFAVYMLSSADRSVSGYRLTLVGVSTAAALTSVTSYLLTHASINQAQQAATWLSGSLSGRSMADVYPVALALVVMSPALCVLGPQLGVLQLGDKTALGLGASVESGRRALLVTAAVLAAAATASAGPVLFVALVAPPLAKWLARTSTANLLLAGLVGAALVCAGDVSGRLLAAPSELPVGVMTAIAGAPVLLWLLHRSGVS